MKVLKLAALALVLASCAATPPTPSQVASIGYGGPLPANYKAIVQDYLNRTLKDPFSVVMDFKYAPVQTWIRTAPIQGSQLILGWKVVALVNGKNSFGGYTGFKPYLFMIRDGAIVFEADAETEMNSALLE
jgi:hypothetical protein